MEQPQKKWQENARQKPVTERDIYTGEKKKSNEKQRSLAKIGFILFSFCRAIYVGALFLILLFCPQFTQLAADLFLSCVVSCTTIACAIAGTKK